MATQTPNYNLIKPDYTDPVDVDVLNDNADLIDSALTAKANLVGGKVPESELPSQTQAYWSEADSTEPSYIQNKPTIPNVAVIEMGWGTTDFATVLTCGEIKALVNSGATLIGRYIDPYNQNVTCFVFIAYVEFNADTGGFIQCYADHTMSSVLDAHFISADTDEDVFQG